MKSRLRPVPTGKAVVYMALTALGWFTHETVTRAQTTAFNFSARLSAQLFRGSLQAAGLGFIGLLGTAQGQTTGFTLRLRASRFGSLLSLVSVLGFAAPLHAQYSLETFSFGTGGTSTGAVYALEFQLGEATAGATLNGGDYSLEAGFSAVVAVQTPGAPMLSIHYTATNSVIVSWPASADGFELRQNSNLNTGNWTVPPQEVINSGGSKFVVVNPPAGNLYFRLSKQKVPNAFEVMNLNDAGVGSLRAAIQSATNNATVTFAEGLEGVIVLNSELDISKDLHITGPGAMVLAISGNNTNRVFNVSTGNVVISGLAIRDGWVRGVGNGGHGRGGGIFNSANLVLSDCAVVANMAIGAGGSAGFNAIGGAGGHGLGGGIYNIGTLALVNCTFALNEARGGNGGLGSDRNDANGGYSGGAGGSGLGGAVCNDGILTVTNCTFALNRVTGGNGGNGGEGGLFKGPGGVGGGAEGAGILNRQSCQLAHVTITSGVAERGNGGVGVPNGAVGPSLGGGLRTTTASASAVNSLIALNSLGANGSFADGFDVFGVLISQGYNLIGITNGSGAWLVSDKVGNNVNPLNPLLGVVQDNGGGTPTVALLPGSPAIDQGAAVGLITDQRGLPRPFDDPGVVNAAGGNASDIGAFEVNP